MIDLILFDPDEVAGIDKALSFCILSDTCKRLSR